MASSSIKKGLKVEIDEESLASKTKSKIQQVKSLNLNGNVFVIDDGWTDFEIKREKSRLLLSFHRKH